MNPDVDSMVPSAETTKDVEKKEDEFVAAVEEAEQGKAQLVFAKIITMTMY